MVVTGKPSFKITSLDHSFAPSEPAGPFSSIAMVRLITHNLLACHAKNCTTNNFPLVFKDVQIELREAEFNADFVTAFMPKIEWKALVDAARQARLPSLFLSRRLSDGAALEHRSATPVSHWIHRR